MRVNCRYIALVSFSCLGLCQHWAFRADKRELDMNVFQIMVVADSIVPMWASTITTTDKSCFLCRFHALASVDEDEGSKRRRYDFGIRITGLPTQQLLERRASLQISSALVNALPSLQCSVYVTAGKMIVENNVLDLPPHMQAARPIVTQWMWRRP